MRKAKAAKVQDGDERVRATMETILRDYVPQPSERLSPPGAQYPRTTPQAGSTISDVVRARPWS